MTRNVVIERSCGMDSIFMCDFVAFPQADSDFSRPSFFGFDRGRVSKDKLHPIELGAKASARLPSSWL